jgi:hypothetical protein
MFCLLAFAIFRFASPVLAKERFAAATGQKKKKKKEKKNKSCS